MNNVYIHRPTKPIEYEFTEPICHPERVRWQFYPGGHYHPPGNTYLFSSNPVVFVPDNPGQTAVDMIYTVYKNGNQIICQDGLFIDLEELEGKLPGGKAKNTGSHDKNGVRLSVVPNPVTSAAQVRYSVENPATFAGGVIKLYSLSGQLVQSRNIIQAQGQTRFDMSSLSPGTYVLVLFDQNKRVGQQVLIKD